jgi:hypothetical protein
MANIVGEVRIDACNEQLVEKLTVDPNGNSRKQEIPQRIHPVPACENNGVDHIALGLLILTAVEQTASRGRYFYLAAAFEAPSEAPAR